MVGVRFLRGHSKESQPVLSNGEPAPGGEVDRRQSALAGHVIASTLLNPSPWLFWLIIASPLLLRSWNRGPGEGMVFVCLIFLTNIATASSLAWAASHSRKLMNPKWQRRGLKVAGIMLILAGSFLCWQATVGNFQSLIDQQEIILSVVEEGISTR
jgi:threonine/homoserine/homoserine lactone efflux protein